MHLKLTAILGALLIGVGLSGCITPMDGKSADEVGRQSLMQMSNESSYNFEGEGRITGFVFSSDEKDGNQDAYVEDIVKAFSVEMTGAVDQTQKRMEMVPVIRFEQRNLQGSIKFPVIIDASPDVRILVDTSALALFLKGLKPYEGKYVQLPPELLILMGDPFDTAKREQLQKIYTSIDSKAFSFQPLNDLDKKWGARTKVRMTLDKEQMSRLLCELMVLQISGVKENLKPYQQERLSEALEEGDESESVSACTKSPQALFGMDDLSMNVNLDMGLDGWGRTVSMQLMTDIKQPESDRNMTMSVNLHMFNFGKPKFVLNPKNTDVVQLDKNMSFSQLLYGKEFAAQDEDDEEIAAPVEKPKKPVIKNKSKSKKSARTKR